MFLGKNADTQRESSNGAQKSTLVMAQLEQTLQLEVQNNQKVLALIRLTNVKRLIRTGEEEVYSIIKITVSYFLFHNLQHIFISCSCEWHFLSVSRLMLSAKHTKLGPKKNVKKQNNILIPIPTCCAFTLLVNSFFLPTIFVLDKCEKIDLETCSSLSYNVTKFPNFLGHMSNAQIFLSSEYHLMTSLVHTRLAKQRVTEIVLTTMSSGIKMI